MQGKKKKIQIMILMAKTQVWYASEPETLEQAFVSLSMD